jgi:tripartite-type tricarboxylate transporter receptor subunit TctC
MCVNKLPIVVSRGVRNVGSFFTACVIATACLFSITTQAADYPDKPISILVGFPPGTSTDAVARIIGERLSKELGQPVIVKNRPGVGGSLALGELAKMKPDGYTIALSASGPLGINPHLLKNINYDALKDFAPIGQTSWLPFLLVTNKTKGLDTFPKLVEYARANPDKLTYASIGLGTSSHLLMAMMLEKTGLKMVHVPYTGSSQSQADVIGGNVDMTIDTLVTTLPHVKSGRLNGIAVSTSDRANLDPTIPTLQEQGVPDYNMGAWVGFVAPQGTPPAIIQRLHDEVNRALKDPDIAQRLEALGTQVVTSPSPAVFNDLIVKNYDTWGKLIKQAGLDPK